MIGQARTWNEKQLALFYKDTKGAELGSESDVKMLHWKTSLNRNVFFCFASKRCHFESFMEQLASGSGLCTGSPREYLQIHGSWLCFSPFAGLLLQICLHLPENWFTIFCLCPPSLLIRHPSGKSWSIFWRHQIAAYQVAWLVQTFSLHRNYHPWGLPPISSSKASGIHSPFYTEY